MSVSREKLMKMLSEMHLEDNRIRHPNFPDSARPRKRYTDKTTNGLTNCIKDFLNFSGHQAERVNVMARARDKRKTVYDTMGGAKQIGSIEYIPSGSTPGTSDISSIVFGLPWKIEIKRKDSQSPEQKKYQENVERAGGRYNIYKDFETFYNDYLQLKHERGN